MEMVRKIYTETELEMAGKSGNATTLIRGVALRRSKIGLPEEGRTVAMIASVLG